MAIRLAGLLVLGLSLPLAALERPWTLDAPPDYWRARFLQATAQRYDLALPAWQAALQTSRHPACSADCLAGIAATAHLLGQQPVAAAAFHRLLAEHPDSVPAGWAQGWNRRELVRVQDLAACYRYDFQWYDGWLHLRRDDGLQRILRDASVSASGLTRLVPPPPRHPAAAQAPADDRFAILLDPGPGHWTLTGLRAAVAVRRASPLAPWSGTDLATAWPAEADDLRQRIVTATEPALIQLSLRDADGSEHAWPVSLPVGQRAAWTVQIDGLAIPVQGAVACRFEVLALPQGADVGLGRISRWVGEIEPVVVEQDTGHFQLDDGLAYRIAPTLALPDAAAVTASLLRIPPAGLTAEPVVSRTALTPPSPVAIEFVKTVQAGPDFIDRNQRVDGSWGWEGGGSVEETALVLLGYIGRGYEHRSANRHQQRISKALEWLLAQQNGDGEFVPDTYIHALATLTTAELFTGTNDPALRDVCQKAVDNLLKRLVRDETGRPLGWQLYNPQGGRSGRIDSAPTLLAIMALRSAAAGDLVVGDGLDLIDTWLRPAWLAANEGRPGPLFPSAVLSEDQGALHTQGSVPSVGLAAAVFLKLPLPDPLYRHLGPVVSATVSADQPPDSRYSSMLGCYQLGGPAWQACFPRVGQIVQSRRLDQGHHRGAWPDAPAYAWYPGLHNRLMVAAWNQLTLNVHRVGEYNQSDSKAHEHRDPLRRWPVAGSD